MVNKIIKDLENVPNSIWKDNKEDNDKLIKFIKKNNDKMNPKALQKAIKEKFNLVASIQMLGSIKRRNGIKCNIKYGKKDKWKNGMDVDDAFRGVNTK